MNENIRKTFDASLVELKQSVVIMFQEVKGMFVEIFRIIEKNDLDCIDGFIESDHNINDLEVKINDSAYLVILKQCPVARDLRIIMTAIKIANDLERLADYTVNIAVYLKETHHDNETFRKDILHYQETLLLMIELLSEAYRTDSIELAADSSKLDDFIDQQYTSDIKRYIEIASTRTNSFAEEATRALLVIKKLERAGDHLTNIAEHIIFLYSGKHLELN